MSTTPPTEQTPQPSQGRFDKEQTAFLKQFSADYTQYYESLSKVGSGIRGIRGTKGDKSNWVLQNVYPKFITRFNSGGPDGPNLPSLQKRMVTWFQNNARPKSQVIPAVPSHSPKKPRAINGIDIFEKNYKADITKRTANICEEQGIASQSNIGGYKKTAREMYQGADPDVKAACEEDAKIMNASRLENPAPSEVYASQPNLKYETAASLRSLTGWEWGGYGDVVFFAMGAYRDSNGDVETFNITLSNESSTPSFAGILTNFKEGLHRPFTRFASAHLPQCMIKAEGTQPLTESGKANGIASNVTTQPDSPTMDGTQPPPDTNIASNVIGERVPALEETEAATTITVSDPTTAHISKPYDSAKVLDTSTTSNAVLPPALPANEDNISTECATTIEKTEPATSTTASDVAAPYILQSDNAAEVPTTSATPDATLNQGRKHVCHQETMRTGETQHSKARERKRKAVVQRAESMGVSSKKCKTDTIGKGETQQTKTRGRKRKATAVQREESIKTDTSIPVVRTSARLHSNNYANSYVSVR